jgi:hypothetical protein
VTLPSATSSTTDHGHNPTKIDHGQTSTVIVVSKISSIPAVPERNESSAEIGQAHSRDTEHYALYPKDLDEFALEPLQGNQGVLVDGNKTKTLLEYHADESREYRKEEPNFITLQSPRTYIAFHHKTIYDIIIQLHMSEHHDQKDGSTMQPRFRVGVLCYYLWKFFLYV